jgi:hypothetical protein
VTWLNPPIPVRLGIEAVLARELEQLSNYLVARGENQDEPFGILSPCENTGLVSFI